MNFIKKIIAKELFKVTSLNSVSILIKIFVGVITSKVIAVYVGPMGMALVGNLRNFITTLEAVATLGFENGIIKYVSEYKDNQDKFKKLLSTIFLTILVVCIFLGLILFFLADYFSNHIFGPDYHFSIIFRSLAVALPWYIGNLILIALINGLGNFKKVIYINSIGHIIGLFVSFLLIYRFHVEGALLSIVITPALLFMVSLFFINKEIAIFKEIKVQFYQFKYLERLSSFSIMAFFSSVIGSIIFLLIRKNIINTLGIEKAGYWEAVSRISAYYFMFISTILVIYFLPKLTNAKTNEETKSIFMSYYKGILPVFMLGLLCIYFLRTIVIKVLFTNEFLPVSELFFWQLTGDFLKAASLILGYQFFAKSLTKSFVVLEIVSLSILYFSSNYLISIFGIQGIVMAHTLTYFIYLIVLIIYFRRSLF